MPSSGAAVLPSVSQISQAAQEKDCRTLLLQALSYGTDYDVRPANPSTLVERSQEAASVLTQAMKATSSSSLPDGTIERLLVDALWLVGTLVPPEVESASYQALIHVVKTLVAARPTTLPHRDVFIERLQATLDPALLEASSVLPQGGKEMLVKRLRKLNTDLYYRQQKYNLLQEESEGYAKLLALLTSSSSKHNNNNTLSTTTRECMAAFDLDPNRVLDLVLDVLESEVSAADDLVDDDLPIALLELMQGFCLAKVPHLIGFKFTSYESSDRDIPNSLYLTTALLAQRGVLDLKALLPHLPSTSEIDSAYKIFASCERQRVQSMGRIRLNLNDSSKQNAAEIERSHKLQQARLSMEKNSLVRLAHVLVQRGHWNVARQSLLPTRDLWSHVCTLLPDTVGRSVCDLVQNMIQPVYQAIVQPPSLSGNDDISVKGNSAIDSKTSPALGSPTTILTATSSLEEVIQTISEPLLCIVESGCIESRPILYCQLCRLLHTLLQKNGDEGKSLSETTYTLLRTFLVPSLSLFAPSPAISAELWSVLSLLPYATRYRLYKDWRGPGLEKAGLMRNKPLVLAQTEMEAGKAARYVLKRLSKDNVRDMGRQVAKVTHSNPLVVFTTILNQIESYDNLIQMMVETVRFVTPLSLDVLGYCVLSRLSGSNNDSSNRIRLKDDGVNVSQWLSSLESFTGAFYKKCPEVEFRGILCFLIRRLKDGHVVELGVLRNLLKTAGGYSFADYSSTASLSIEQLEGRSGTQLLKRETCAFGVVERLNRRSSQRVRSVLQSDGMGVTVLILLAQVRFRILYHQKDMRAKPIKLIGNLFDTCNVVMGMLLEFLTDSTDEEQGDEGAIAKYAESMPTLGDLRERYGLDPASAWMLCRPLIRAAMFTLDAGEEKKPTDKLSEHTALRQYLPSYPSVRKTYHDMLPETAWSNITPDLFEVFYSHSLYDVHCPANCYEAEISRLTKEVERLTQHQKGGAGAAAAKSVLAATAAAAGGTQREIARAMVFSRADEAELERVKHNSSVLCSDMTQQRKHCELIRKKLVKKKTEFFPSNEATPSMAETFLTHCVYPRCTLSPDDAMYCANFVSILHEIETPGFSTLHYFNELINAIAGTLFCVTEGEAANTAVLLWETWNVISRWRYSEKAYENEVAGKPGSFMVENGDSADDGSGETSVSVTYERYKALYNKWHATIGEAALGCLKSSEYMQMRACLLVLTRIVNVFPTRPGLGLKLMDALSPLLEDSNPLQDIKAMAQAYAFQIGKARDDGVWKEEGAAATKARLAKERAAVAERKKKAAKRFEEMKRESDQITEELGNSHTRGREERRRAPSRGPGGDARLRTPLNPTAPKFEPASGKSMPVNRAGLGNGDSTRDSGWRGGDDPRARGRERDRERQGFDERRGDGTETGGNMDTRHRGGRATPQGLEGRWQRNGPPAAGRDIAGVKRGRSPGRDAGGPGDSGMRGPGGRETDREEHPHPSKRQRIDRELRDGGDRDGPRSRGGSPTHRGFRQPQRGPPPPPQPQHGDRVGGTRSDRRGPPRR